MQGNKGKVLVTGASGYIASHLIHDLLLKDYYVVGTVRSLANK
jgi:nucleoside-diphosphate-sugar epimerase